MIELEGIDVKKTRKNVYDLIRKYKKLLNLAPIRCMPSITSKYDFIPPSTNYDLNPIETAVNKNIKREQMMKERKELAEKMHEAIECLTNDEKYIIVKKLLEQEAETDYNIYTDLGIGKTKYHEIKNEAILKLAFYFNIEVYEYCINN